MDPKFVALYQVMQEADQSLFISCLVQGVLVTGFIANEQKFFVETNRIMNDEFDTDTKTNIFFEELFLGIAKQSPENSALHLAGVKMYLPTGIQNFPSMRIDPTQVSAWTLLMPGEKDSLEYLPRFFPGSPRS